MSYLRVCVNCGTKSERDIKYCPECGVEKQIKFSDKTLYGTFVKNLASKLPFLKNGESLISLILNLLLTFIGLLLINPFLESSKLLWILFFLFSSQGILKEVTGRVEKIKILPEISLVIIYIYLGAGLGNYISYAGKNITIYISDFFYPSMILNEISSGNALIIIGAISGIIFMILFRYIFNILK